MKVAIITFHNAYNNGAVLQAYATQEIIHGLGHDVEIVDYHNRAVDDNYIKQKFHFKKLFELRPWLIPFYLLEKVFFRKQRNAYQLFQKKYLRLSSRRYNQSKDAINLGGYDVILIGSDQLWNKSITGGYDNVYWGDISTTNNTKIIAWSICMNNLHVDEYDKKFIESHLRNVSAISVRESDLVTFLKSFTDKDIIHTMDPTLLLPVTLWKKLCHPIKERNFIFVYAIRNEAATYALAKKIASRYNKDIIIFHNTSSVGLPEHGHIQCGGPDDFLSYISQAEMVVTSSFHGTAFSLIFEKPFICYEPADNKNMRIHSLLKTVGLESNIVSNENQLPDFTEYRCDLDTVCNPTIMFLRDILKNS